MNNLIASALVAAAFVSPAQAQLKLDAEGLARQQKACISIALKEGAGNYLEGHCLAVIVTVMRYESSFNMSCYKTSGTNFAAWAAIRKAIVFQALADNKEMDNITNAFINASRKLYPCPGK